MAKKITKPESPAPERAPETKAVAPVREGKHLVKSTGKKLAGRGFENLEMSDVLLPRVKLLQNGSPEVAIAKTAKAGEIIIGLSGENFGSKGVLITPIMHFRSRIKWVPKDDGGGIDCSSPDAKAPRDTKYAQTCSSCTHKDWNNDEKKKKDQQPHCTLYENFLVLINDSENPVIIPMEKTKAKVAKKLWSMGALKGNQDMWNFQYKLGVVEEVSSNDEAYWNYTASDSGKKTSEDVRKKCEQLWESMASKTISEQNQDAEGQESAAAAAGGQGKY